MWAKWESEVRKDRDVSQEYWPPRLEETYAVRNQAQQLYNRSMRRDTSNTSVERPASSLLNSSVKRTPGKYYANPKGVPKTLNINPKKNIY